MTKHECEKEKVITDIFMQLTEQGTILKRLDKAINGNGKEGLVEKVNDIENVVAGIMAVSKYSKWSLGISLTVASIVIGFIFKLNL